MYNLTKMPGELVRVEGLAAEPFLISCGSCQSYLNRLFARKGTYSAEEYARKRQPYLEAAQIAGWEIVDPEPKAVEPTVVPAVDLTDLQKCARNELDEETRREILTTGIITHAMSRVEPTVTQDSATAEEPPEQVSQMLLKAFAEAVEPEVPAVTSPATKTWLERMMGEDPAESLVNGIDFSELT